MRSGNEVAIFVTRGARREVLVALRAPDLGGYWHTIAGGVEPGETAAQAASRELCEETGLDAPALEQVEAVTEYMYALNEEPAERRAQYDPGVVAVRVHCFVADAPDGWEPTLDAEHDVYRWCSVEEAVALLRWPDTAAALRRALASP